MTTKRQKDQDESAKPAVQTKDGQLSAKNDITEKVAAAAEIQPQGTGPPQLIAGEEVKKYSEITATAPRDKRAAIAIHPNPDADAIASAIAVRHDLISRGFEVDIFGDGSSSHPQNKALINSMQIEIKPSEFFWQNQKSGKSVYGLIIFCDSNKGSACLKGASPDIIFDHHAESEIAENCLNINKKVGACSTIIFYLLKAMDTTITPEIMTALTIGINADTKQLTKKDEVTEWDRGAHEAMRAQLNYSLFEHINSQYEMPRSFLIAMGVVAAEDYSDYVVVRGLGEITNGQKDVCAITADLIFRDPGARLVVVIAVEDGQYILASIRTDLELISIDDFCKKVFIEPDSSADEDEKKDKPSAGARTGSGGAKIPLSNREKEEWAVADDNERKILFGIKLKRYRSRIKSISEA